MRDFFTLLRRELRRFLILPNQTIVPPILTAILYILIFGYSVGFRIESIQGYSYIVYILPGLIMMGVITSSYSNSSTSLFIARYEDFIQDLLVSPLSYLKMVSAYIISSSVRGLIVGGLTLLVSVLLTSFPIEAPLVMFVFLVLASSTFGAYGILVGLWAERWDHLAVFQNYLITPLIFLGGVFYNIRELPYPWQQISYLNPLFYMVDGFRYGILGVSAVPPWLSGTVIFLLLSIGSGLSMYLFKIGWKLRD